MTVQLTTKERMLMQDQKSQEELCVQKYHSYAGLAQDPQLKQLFSSLAQKEQEHLNSINQILSGQIPAMGAQSGGQSQQKSMQPGMQSQGQSGMQSQGQPGTTRGQSGQGTGGTQSGMFSDKNLCSDMLSTEKYVSSAYDTAIFECTDASIRQVLNHIQKEEQEHGEQIFNYMQSHGMYSTQ
ncbi:MAG: spore coat protein [Anaerovoracaceae bacterium]